MARNPQPISANIQQLSRATLLSAFQDLDARLTKHREQRAAQLRKTAEGFSVFDFIEPSENRLSDVLRFLLDPEASHGQGTTFLRALAGRANLAIPDLVGDTLVTREAITYSIKRRRRRIDVVLTVSDFVLGIETKKFAGEQTQQISDYCEHLNNIAGDKSCLIFLTRTGAGASSIKSELASELQKKGRLRCWSWDRDIAAWLKECAAKTEANKIRHFIEDFQSYITNYLAMPDESEESA